MDLQYRWEVDARMIAAITDTAEVMSAGSRSSSLRHELAERATPVAELAEPIDITLINVANNDIRKLQEWFRDSVEPIASVLAAVQNRPRTTAALTRHVSLLVGAVPPDVIESGFNATMDRFLAHRQHLSDRLQHQLLESTNKSLEFSREEEERARRDEQKAQYFNFIATLLGAVVLVPTLVATVFGASVKVPSYQTREGFWLLLFLMGASGTVTYCVIRVATHASVIPGAGPPLGRAVARLILLAATVLFAAGIASSGAIAVGILVLAASLAVASVLAWRGPWPDPSEETEPAAQDDDRPQ